MENTNTNKITKKGITLYTTIEGLFIATAIVLVVLGTKYAGLSHKWPASIALLLFILDQKKISNIKNIFCGAAVGIILAASLPSAVKLSEQYIGPLKGPIGALFLYIVLIVMLGDVLHICFNSITFCYFTIAASFTEQMAIPWLITLIIGGGFLIGSFIIFEKIMIKKWNTVIEVDSTMLVKGKSVRSSVESEVSRKENPYQTSRSCINECNLN